MVIPCFNEEKVLTRTAVKLGKEIMSAIGKGLVSGASRIMFVDDGSTDQTWGMIDALHEQCRLFTGVKLTGNSGQQNALLAGMKAAMDGSADMVITMDADLQDDPSAIESMLKAYYQGKDVVYGVRKDRRRDSLFKRMSAELFYLIINLSGGNLIFNHADFRLMSKRAILSLLSCRDSRPFLRGMLPSLRYPSAKVYYERQKRSAGESKYTIGKMAGLAWDGIISVSVRPLYSVGIVGAVMCILTAVRSMWEKKRTGQGSARDAAGTAVWCAAGVQLLAMGVLGIYLGRIYQDGKGIPLYFIDKVLNE